LEISKKTIERVKENISQRFISLSYQTKNIENFLLKNLIPHNSESLYKDSSKIFQITSENSICPVVEFASISKLSENDKEKENATNSLVQSHSSLIINNQKRQIKGNEIVFPENQQKFLRMWLILYFYF